MPQDTIFGVHRSLHTTLVVSEHNDSRILVSLYRGSDKLTLELIPHQGDHELPHYATTQIQSIIDILTKAKEHIEKKTQLQS